MRIFVLLLLFMHLLYGAKVLTHDLQVTPENVTLTLTFDTPYEDAVRKSYQDGYLIIRLQGLNVESSFVKDELSSLVKSLMIQSQNGETMIIADTDRGTLLKVSKSKDAFTMRLTLVKPSDSLPVIQTNIQTNIQTSHFDWLDYTIMFLLALAGAFGIYRLTHRQGSKPIILFSDTEKPDTPEDPEITLSIIYEKEVDENNRALLLRYKGKEYPVILGEKNFFLTSDTPLQNRKSFENLIEDHYNMIKEQEDNARLRQTSVSTHGPFESYKEKASGKRSLFDGT